MTTSVYVIAHADNVTGQSAPPVKIGFSSDPEKRLRGLQSGNPHRLVVHGFYDCGSLARAVEQSLHEKFKSQRVMGEWFMIDPDRALLNVIGDLVDMTTD